MVKIVIIFCIGFVEQLLYTAYLMSIHKNRVKTSSILMSIYMSIYLFIISYAIKDINTAYILFVYALSCGLGNYVFMMIGKNKRKDCNNCISYNQRMK